MSRSAWSIVAVVMMSWSAFAGDQFTVSLSGGTMSPNSISKRLGIGFLGGISYSLLEDVSVSLSSGYMTWGYRTTERYNARMVPIAFGARYYFGHGSVTPYACGELSYVIGEAEWSTVWDRYTGEIKTGTKSISEFGSGLGLGIEVPVSDRLRLDVGSMIHLSQRAAEVPFIRFMLGFGYGL